jgi:hypothetical protein
MFGDQPFSYIIFLICFKEIWLLGNGIQHFLGSINKFFCRFISPFNLMKIIVAKNVSFAFGVSIMSSFIS